MLLVKWQEHQLNLFSKFHRNKIHKATTKKTQ